LYFDDELLYTDKAKKMNLQSLPPLTEKKKKKPAQGSGSWSGSAGQPGLEKKKGGIGKLWNKNGSCGVM